VNKSGSWVTHCRARGQKARAGTVSAAGCGSRAIFAPTPSCANPPPLASRPRSRRRRRFLRLQLHKSSGVVLMAVKGRTPPAQPAAVSSARLIAAAARRAHLERPGLSTLLNAQAAVMAWQRPLLLMALTSSLGRALTCRWRLPSPVVGPTPLTTAPLPGWPPPSFTRGAATLDEGYISYPAFFTSQEARRSGTSHLSLCGQCFSALPTPSSQPLDALSPPPTPLPGSAPLGSSPAPSQKASHVRTLPRLPHPRAAACPLRGRHLLSRNSHMLQHAVINASPPPCRGEPPNIPPPTGPPPGRWHAALKARLLPGPRARRTDTVPPFSPPHWLPSALPKTDLKGLRRQQTPFPTRASTLSAPHPTVPTHAPPPASPSCRSPSSLPHCRGPPWGPCQRRLFPAA
jgi:hypothetical protein